MLVARRQLGYEGPVIEAKDRALRRMLRDVEPKPPPCAAWWRKHRWGQWSKPKQFGSFVMRQTRQCLDCGEVQLLKKDFGL